MIVVDWVRYGRPAAAALRAALSDAKGDDPLAPVTVVVPSNHVGVAARRLLGSGVLGPMCGRGVGVAGVSFLTVYRLAELLGAAGLAAAGRRPVSTPVIAAGLRAALAAEPGVFEPVASHPATESALVTTYRELRDVSPAALDALARRGRRARDVVRLHRLARAWLEPSWYDEEDLMASAAAELHGVADLGAVVVYLPQRLSRHAADLLLAVGGRVPLRVVAGTTGDERADEEVRRSMARLGEVTAAEADGGALVAPGRTRLVTTSDSDEEVRLAVRAVVEAARAGTPLDRIAILHPGPDPYPRLIHEHLDAAGVRANGPSALPLTARVAGRAIVTLLDLPAGGFRRDDVFAWLAAAPVRHNGTPVPVSAWERISREAGVVAGRADWADRLERLAAEFDAEVAAADPDEPEWREQRALDQARRARNLRRFMLELIDDVARASAGTRRWSDHAMWARGHLQRLADEDHWPRAERDASARVDRALARLAALDEVDGEVTLEVFSRTLALELDADLGRIGRFGDGVFVGSLSMGVGLDLDLVVVLGLAEGSLPSTVHDDSLLPDSDRMATGDELALAGHRTDRQHRWLLAALAGAEGHLLCSPRGDLRRSTERVLSRWAVDLAAGLAAGLAGVEHVASFDAGVRGLAFPATAQEHRLRTLMAGSLDDVVVARGDDMVRGRRSDRFTRFDGNLAGLDVPAPTETSASRLERWVGCPFAYLMGDILGVDLLDNPEDRLQVAPMVKGELVHAILERFIVELLARPADEQPDPDQAWSDDDGERMIAIADEVCAAYEARGLTGRSIFWGRDRARVHDDVRRFLREDDAVRRANRSRPTAVELAFGVRGATMPAVPFPLPDGRTVRFRGKADRVDETDDGGLRVIDYKTGKADRYKGLGADDPDLGGRKLQLPIYALAARRYRGIPTSPVDAEYWFVSRVGNFTRLGYRVTDDILDRVGARILAVVEGIEGGIFPSHPTAASTTPFVECPWCDPDALGVADLQRRWSRKRADPALARYVDMLDA